MSYSKFTTKEVIKVFNLSTIRDNFLKEIKIAPSEFLLLSMDSVSTLELESEKARSEFIIAPILLELRRTNSEYFNIHSGKNLESDPERGLTGECDFILSKKTTIITDMPIFAIVEAKKENITAAYGQLIAQMIGSDILNKKEKNNIKTIFGAVTTGEIWQFMKLENGNIITIENKRYYIDNLDGILGALQQIIDYNK